MSIRVGDWVRSEWGAEGRVVKIGREMAVVAVHCGRTKANIGYPADKLKRIDEPAMYEPGWAPVAQWPKGAKYDGFCPPAR
jgi:hypothetical protein